MTLLGLGSHVTHWVITALSWNNMKNTVVHEEGLYQFTCRQSIFLSPRNVLLHVLSSVVCLEAVTILCEAEWHHQWHSHFSQYVSVLIFTHNAQRLCFSPFTGQ